MRTTFTTDQLADPDIAAWTIKAVHEAAVRVGRDPGSVTFCVAAPAYVTDGSPDQLAHAREQCRWFGGMVGNHVADIVGRYGTGDDGSSAVPQALTAYIKGREGYDYNEHGRAGNTHASFVPDEIVDRFCIIGPVEHQIARIKELQSIGADQYAVYLQHDDMDATLAAYGNRVIPGVAEAIRAKA